MNLTILGPEPSSSETLDALLVAARALDRSTCFWHDSRFHFALGGGWSIALSSDSAGRIKVETCKLTRPRSRMWVLAHAHDRLAGLVVRMSNQVAEPV